MNKLALYLVKNKISQKDFAKEIGISTAGLHYYLRLGRMPSIVVASRIKEFTKGFIDYEDWLPDAAAKPKKDHKKKGDKK